MNEIEHKYAELLTLIRNLSNGHVPKEYNDISQASKIVKDFTKTIWESKRYNLLIDLENLTKNTHHDIQQFWFECLSYPYSSPIKKDTNGKCISKNYYNLPSDFNDVEFHDSRVIDIKVTKDIEMTIDLIEDWQEEEKGWKQIGRRKKLYFFNAAISAYASLKDRTRNNIEISSLDYPNSEILDFWELPAIKHFQAIEGFSCDYQKRVFKMDSTAEGYAQIFIVADKWNIEKISNESHTINYAFKANR